MANELRSDNRVPSLLVAPTIGTAPLAATGVSLTNATPVHVAIVDGTGTQLTSFGGGTQYAEGATTSPGTGTLALGRYLATPPSLTDGKLSGLQLDAAGNLKITGSITTGGATDNAAFTAGTSTGTPVLGFYHATIDTVTDGRAAAVGITSKRALFANLQNASGVEVGTTAAPLKTQFSDGTNTANVLKSDGTAAGQNAQLVAGAYLELGSLTAGSLNADLVPSTDVSGYKSWSLQVTGTWAGTLSFQGSNDNSNFNAIIVRAESTASGGAASTTTVNNVFTGPVNYRYLRVRMTAYTSGTATGIVELYTIPAPSLHSIISAAQSGTWTVQPGNTANTTPWLIDARGNVADAATDAGNPVKVGGKYNLTVPTYTDGQRSDLQISARGNLKAELWAAQNSISAIADNSDAVAVSATTNKLGITSRNTVFNGTTWDRMSGDTTGVNVHLIPNTTGGWSVKSLVALSNTKTAIKAGAGTFGGYMFYNPNATVIYLQVWNVAIGSITVGTTAATYVIPIPATSGANIEFTNGISHTTEINIAATTTATNSTAPGVAIDGFALYK